MKRKRQRRKNGCNVEKINTITIGRLRKEREKETERDRGRENEESIKKIEERNFSFFPL